MSDLLDFAIDRHGGAERWHKAKTLSATVRVHGSFRAFKGQPALLGTETVRAAVHRQHITMTPFGTGSRLEFDAELDRVGITGPGGDVRDELTAPRRSMAGYTGAT